MDGAALITATNDELKELGFDGVLTRKLRMKIADHGRDRTAGFKVEELRIFLKRCGLQQYQDRLIKDLGVFDIDELPDLVDNKQWVRSLRMRVEEELRFKVAIRKFVADKVAAERARLEQLGLLRKQAQRNIALKHDMSASLNIHARENVNAAIRDQGLSDMDTRKLGNPKWFQVSFLPIYDHKFGHS